jgi:hypothetical protein
MEKDAKPVVEHQHYLIPNMKDVVRNEVLKLLDAGIIYPIADSRWLSPIHCVPKKGGMTVVPNENNCNALPFAKRQNSCVMCHSLDQ